MLVDQKISAQSLNNVARLSAQRKKLRASRQSLLDRALLIQIILCIVPFIVTFVLVSHWTAAICFFAVFLPILGYCIVCRKPIELATIVLGTLPVSMYARNWFFYLSVILSVVAVMVLIYLSRTGDFARIWDNQRLRFLLLLTGIYWLMSAFLSGQLLVNIKIMEMSFFAASVYVLSAHKRQFLTALVGYSISAICIGPTFFAYDGSRLGMIEIDGLWFGNPISLGLPLTLVLLLAMVDKGKWIGLEQFGWRRHVVAQIAAVFWILSTSRVSWLAAGVGILLIFVFQKETRKGILGFLLLGILALLLMLHSERGDFVTHWYDKTFSEEKTLTQRSSGRVDQWLLFPEVFMESPLWGFGPGSGQVIYAHYSKLYDFVNFQTGKEFMWHSLVMHLGIETGSIGLLSLFAVIATSLIANIAFRTETGQLLPLLGTVCYLVIALTVTAMDAHSGVFLGIGLIGEVSRRSRPDFRMVLKKGRVQSPSVRVAQVRPR